MAHWHHGPNTTSEPEDRKTSVRNARYGLILFAVYLLLYGGFVALNAFAPRVMESTVVGVNLAILYGMALIVAAFLLAMIYGWLCRHASGGKTQPTGTPNAPEALERRGSTPPLKPEARRP